MTNRKKPILLCILDGWGIGSKNSQNAIHLAKTPHYDQILDNFPHCKLGTSGLDVGLPEGQIGNSEVGHISIGSGRIILQDLPKINQAIANNQLKQNDNLQKLISNCQQNNNICHLMGLLSDGGVHCHQDHIIALAKILAENNIKVWLHCFLDGRDVAQKSAEIFLKNLLKEIDQYPQIKIASLSGRYFAMDRDNNWDRIKIAFDAIALAKSQDKFDDPIAAINSSYQNDITDEFLRPIAANYYQGIKDGDGLLIANFRADRIRQISDALLKEDFDGFAAKKIKFCFQSSMTKYSDDLDKYLAVLFPNDNIKNSLPEILANNNLKQLRIAETEKYAHVTFFFGGGREREFTGEKRILVKSPNIATYDLLPEMAAKGVGEELSKAIKKDEYDFIVVNYANPDMVGHSGVLPAAIKACEVIDDQLAMLKDLILKQDGIMIISADHGNIEDMIDDAGNPHTAHTTNLVPFILISNNGKNYQLKNGRLCDIAPTILHLMGIDKPSEMKGENLISN